MCKVCVKCNTEKPLTEFHNTTSSKTGKVYKSNTCKVCSRLEQNARYETPASRASRLVCGMRSRCKKKGLEYDLTNEWVQEKLEAGVCEVTGIPLELKGGGLNNGGRPFAPSLDRTDPTKGYTMDNVKVVCWIYNGAKGVGTHEDVIKLAEALINVK